MLTCIKKQKMQKCRIKSRYANKVGPEQIIDLIDARMDVAESSMMNLISTGVYSDGTGSGGLQITGLQAIVPNDTTTGTVAGISRAHYSFWRAQWYVFSVSAAASASASNIQ